MQGGGCRWRVEGLRLSTLPKKKKKPFITAACACVHPHPRPSSTETEHVFLSSHVRLSDTLDLICLEQKKFCDQ